MSYFLRKLFFSTFLLPLFFCSLPTGELVAQELPKIAWAGVSLAGDFSSAPKLMPNLYELLNDGSFLKKLENRLDQNINSSNKYPDFIIVTRDEEQLRQGDDSYALSFVLSGESVTTYTIEQTSFVDYVIQSLVLVGNVSKDPSRQRIVTSYPVQVKYQDAYQVGNEPSVEKQKEIIAKMLLGEVGQADLVAEWQKRLEQIKFREKQVWISVAPLSISPEAQKQGEFNKEQADRVAFKVSSLIEGNISRSANIPIVPSTFDGALDSLTLSFADRGIVAFIKPDPSFTLQVSVYGLGTNSVEEAMTKLTKYAVAYGGGFLVDYYRNNSDKSRDAIFSMRLQNVQTVTYLGTSRDVQRAAQADMFSRLISAFADEVSNNLIPANQAWIEKHKASSEKQATIEIARLVAKELPPR